MLLFFFPVEVLVLTNNYLCASLSISPPKGILPKVDVFGSNCPRKACYTSNEPCPSCPSPSPAPQVQPQPVCTICDKNNKNRPSSLTIEYNAGQGVNQNEQGSKSYGSGLFGSYGATTTVSTSGFSASVKDGESFTVSGSFSAETTFSVGGQSITFHTSCSVPLKTGDRFGPLRIVGSDSCGNMGTTTSSCWPYGCCGGTDIGCNDESCSNCCNPAAFEGCTRCCEDGSLPPCCVNMPEFVEEVDLKGQTYTGTCTVDNTPHVETAHALANYIKSFGNGMCKGHNGEEKGMLWSASIDGSNFFDYDQVHYEYPQTSNCCNVNQKPFSAVSPQVCCPNGEWSDVMISPEGFSQCGSTCSHDADSELPLCELGTTCSEGRPESALLDFANSALCDGFDEFQCPSLAITFRCCDPCDPDAKCVESNGAFYMQDCPTCERRPAVREKPNTLVLEHFGVCDVPGKLPSLQNFALQAWFADFGGMVCVSANELSASETPMDQKLDIIPTISISANDAAVALCSDETCPSVPVTFECCDPCDPTLCKSMTEQVLVSDCCPHHPKLLTPAGSLQVQKVSSCTFAQLPSQTDTALSNWYESMGGSICVSQNNPESDMIWSASPSLSDAEHSLCYSGGCPTIDVVFKCCDPCDPTHKCVSTMATFSIFDTNPPEIEHDTGNDQQECDGNPEAALANWLGTATCNDIEGEVVFTNSATGESFNQAPEFTTTDRCKSATAVRFDCVDDCDLATTAVYSFEVTDTMPPTVVTSPSNVEIECDGQGNVEALTKWLKNAGGMSVEDACQGACPYTNDEKITHFRGDEEMRHADWHQVVSISDTLTGMSSWPGHVYGYDLATASNIVIPTLHSTGPFTIFMPLDSAFDKINHIGIDTHGSGVSVTEDLLAHSSETAKLFLDHIAVGHVDISTMQIGDTISMVSNSETLTLVSTSPTYRFSAASTNHWTEFSVVGAHGDAHNSGYLCTNGMVYYIDEVVLGSYPPWQAVASGFNPDNHHNGDHNDNNCDLILFSASDVDLVDTGCGKFTSVDFTANDGCGNSVTETGSFSIVDTTQPELVKEAKSCEYAYTSYLENQAQFSEFLDTRAGATARDLCTAEDDLVWSNDYNPNQLLPAECDHENLNEESCNCIVTVEFCVQDCSVLFVTDDPVCTTATFALTEKDAAPVINPGGDLCPGMDLEHPCDSRCPGYADFWEFDARTAMDHWIDEQACLCATDCTDVHWRAVNVPEGELCGASGVVTFVATDETGNTATKDQYYNFPAFSPAPDACESAPYGCCPGTVTERVNSAGTNCPCSSSLYGCCPDMATAKEDSRGNNCYDVQPPPPEPGCTICDRNNKNRPSSLTIEYIAGQGVNQNEQGSKSYGDLTAIFPASATITTSGNNALNAQVKDGDVFTVTGSFPAESTFYVSGGSSFTFHTSCSVTLKYGDRYGPFKILGGGQCVPPDLSPGCGDWGCCDGTEDPKIDGVGTNCCGAHGCCNDGSSCVDSECSTCPCQTEPWGCCPGTLEARDDLYGLNCPLPCSLTEFGCCPDGEASRLDAEGSNCTPEEICTLPTICTLEIPPHTPPPPCSEGFGCCLGTEIPQLDPEGTNCPCTTTVFGCCDYPWDLTTTFTANQVDCPCGEHGCCGVNGESDILKDDSAGTNCPCEYTEHGCCPNTETVAQDATGTNCPCGTTEGAPDCPCIEQDFIPCTICDKSNKNRPSFISVQYRSAGANSNNQGSKAKGDLTGTFPSPARVTIGSQTFTVEDGEYFTIQGSFGAELDVHIENPDVSCQTGLFTCNEYDINFHTSCSVELKTGDQFGPLMVISSDSCSAPELCADAVQTSKLTFMLPAGYGVPQAALMAEILCGNPCTGVSFSASCEVGPDCVNYSPVVCKTPETCVESQCSNFLTGKWRAGSNGKSVTAADSYCDFNAAESCPFGTEAFTSAEVPTTKGKETEVAEVPDGCQCCAYIKTKIVCNTCSEPTLVECNAVDPQCKHYSKAICEPAGFACPEAPTDPPPAPSQCGHTFDACSVQGSKFKTVELEWTGNVLASEHKQLGKRFLLKPKSKGIDTVNGGSAVKALGKKLGKIKTKPWRGDVYSFSAADGSRFLPSKFAFKVDKGKFTFTVNCRKAPFRMGDQFGPFTVIGFETQKQDSTCLSGRAAALGQSEPDDLAVGSNGGNVANAAAGSTGNASADTSTLIGVVVGAIVLMLVIVGVVGAVVCRSTAQRAIDDDAFTGVLEPENESEPSLDDGATQLNNQD